MDKEDPWDFRDEKGGDAAARPKHGLSFSYASKTGAVYTRSRKIEYGQTYTAGDVVGCLLELTNPPPPPIEERILHEGTK